MFSNNKLTNIIIWITMIGVVCFIAGGSILGSEFKKCKNTSSQGSSSQDILDEKSAGSIDGIDEIEIVTDSIDIRVISYDGSDVKARLTGSVNKANIPTLSVSNASGKIQIKATSKSTFIIFGFFEGLYFDVYVPAKYANSLKVDSSSGGIVFSDFNLTQAQCTTHSGSLKVNNIIAKKIELESSSGSINANNIKGSIISSSHSGSSKFVDVDASDMDVSSSSGSIAIEGIPGALKAESTSGSVKADISKLSGEISIKTSSGSCRIGLPSDAQFHLKANSSSGNINCSFPVSGDTGDHFINGSVNDGETEITVKTISGSISIN